MKLHSKTKGSIGELSVLKELYNLGIPAYTEFGDNAKVDIIALDNNHCVKIQVKSKSPVQGKVELHKASSGPNYSYKYQSDEVDLFAVYVLGLDLVLWVPFSSFNSTITIRMQPSKNNQKTGVHSSDDFLEFRY